MLDWVSIFCRARRQNPYKITHFHHANIYNFRELASVIIRNKHQDKEGNLINWLLVKSFRYVTAQPGVIMYRYNYTDEFKTIRVFGRSPPPLLPHPLPEAYSRRTQHKTSFPNRVWKTPGLMMRNEAYAEWICSCACAYTLWPQCPESFLLVNSALCLSGLHPLNVFIRVQDTHPQPGMDDAKGELREKAVANGALHQQHQNKNPRPVILPPYSTRTLHHPSFLPLYMAVGSTQGSRQAPGHWGISVPAMIPSDFFYTDPTLPPGGRVLNCVTQLEAFECCQLNTPPPVMSTIADSAPGFDPFRRQPHPTRDLGTQLWTWDSLSTFKPRTAGGKISEVIQLSAEEEEAITGLLRLHYQSSQEAPSAAPWGNTSLQDPGADDQQSIKRATSSPPPLCDSGPAPNSVENILPRQPMLESAAVMATSNCLVRMENGTSHLGENLPSMTQGATGSQET
ncbi:hypothetical protein GJAV_G00197440 [Gymnothorax javanicus]|nr:hypothetical protein GJAV_G00197440 [Gymnothorax javanicus]